MILCWNGKSLATIIPVYLLYPYLMKYLKYKALLQIWRSEVWSYIFVVHHSFTHFCENALLVMWLRALAINAWCFAALRWGLLGLDVKHTDISAKELAVWLTHCCRETLKGVHRQTVQTQIRHRIMRHLIWVCTVCLCTPFRVSQQQWVKHLGLSVTKQGFEPVWVVWYNKNKGRKNRF